MATLTPDFIFSPALSEYWHQILSLLNALLISVWNDNIIWCQYSVCPGLKIWHSPYLSDRYENILADVTQNVVDVCFVLSLIGNLAAHLSHSHPSKSSLCQLHLVSRTSGYVSWSCISCITATPTHTTGGRRRNTFCIWRWSYGIAVVN